jgi:Reverse transcriptase (RNA-dependent DNA polymerase)
VAPKLWYLHLHERLEAQGFKPSAIDPCLYFCHGVASAVYVDDVVMISKTKQEINAIIMELIKEFKVTDEGELTGFFRIDVKWPGNTFKLSQPTLIKIIGNLAGLQDCKSNKVPTTEVLGSLVEDPPHDKDWEYASICIRPRQGDFG